MSFASKVLRVLGLRKPTPQRFITTAPFPSRPTSPQLADVEQWDEPELTLDLDTRPICGRPESYDPVALDALVAIQMLDYKPPEVTAEQVMIYAGMSRNDVAGWCNDNPHLVFPEQVFVSPELSDE